MPVKCSLSGAKSMPHGVITRVVAEELALLEALLPLLPHLPHLPLLLVPLVLWQWQRRYLRLSDACLWYITRWHTLAGKEGKGWSRSRSLWARSQLADKMGRLSVKFTLRLSVACMRWLTDCSWTYTLFYIIIFYFKIYAICQRPLTPRVVRLWLYWACGLHNSHLPPSFPYSILRRGGFYYHMGVCS